MIRKGFALSLPSSLATPKAVFFNVSVQDSHLSYEGLRKTSRHFFCPVVVCFALKGNKTLFRKKILYFSKTCLTDCNNNKVQ